VRHPIVRTVSAALLVILVGYIAAVGYLYLFQRSYVFHPSGLLAAPGELGLEGVEAVTLTMRDGTPVTAWYAEAAPGRPTLIYFHGNAGNISGRADRFRQVLGSGFGLLAVSYRGFPGSGGTPSEADFTTDAQDAFDWLASRTSSIVIYGESLGTGVATRLAAERSAQALVLEAPFTATVDIAAATYPWVPVSYLMQDQFLSREHIQRVDEPVLIVHGTADGVVPIAYGRQLYEVAGEPKRMEVIEGAEHHNLWEHDLWRRVLGFLEENGVVAGYPDAAAVRRIPSWAG